MENKELNERKKNILKLIVTEYIETIDPISSQTIIDKYGLDVSSATIRNDMAELEKLGYIEKTHYSSGRMPSNKGYEFYVNNLMCEGCLREDEIKYINDKLNDQIEELEELSKITTNTISEITHYTAISVNPDIKKQIIEEIKFVLIGTNTLMAIILTTDGLIKETIIKLSERILEEQVNILTAFFNNKLKGKSISEIHLPLEKYIIEEINLKASVIRPIAKELAKIINQKKEIYCKGYNKILDNPEFEKNNLAKKFYKILDEEDEIEKILSNSSEEDFKVYIGNAKDGLEDLSIVTFKNTVRGRDYGTIGIIGPTRMDYSKVISVLKYINKKLNMGRKVQEIGFPIKLLPTGFKLLKEPKDSERRENE